MEKKENLHVGHRERLRKLYLQGGPEYFPDHQLLEIILFYAVPRKDTNEMAHRLLNEFGNIVNLLESRPEEICRRGKVTENVGILISLIMELKRRYQKQSSESKLEFSQVDSVVNYLIPLFLGKRHEIVYILCLDSANRLIHSVPMGEGSTSSLNIDIQQVARIALTNYASTVILAHNHPSGNVNPSISDIETTNRLYKTLKLLRILLVEHIIISGDTYFSFAKNNLLPPKDE